ncbi:MAG: thymidine phosphorylase [Alphaproteobacteria bacterium]|nr:thymidine phosphorylase [Alphaproteobacteria bacterium]
MLPQEIIRKKRNHQSLTEEEIKTFINGVTSGEIVDAQTAAFTMAVFLNGMTKEETAALTLAMRDSGDVLKWNNLNGPVVDKHSTGGVGDKISLMLAPMIAACGGYVPMISGRGLGHTGGTLDKFDSIPGYQTVPSNELFRKTVKNVGCAIIGQTGNLAPADKKIYAIRDVCATVESIDLITASILSKKLAAGLNYLIMDLKCGNGAFMDSFENATELASSIVRVAEAAGTKTRAIITDMNQVLGTNVGNALEVAEAVSYLKGEYRDARLHQITLELCAEILTMSKLASSQQEAFEKLENALSSGAALEKFQQMTSALGGPKDFCDNPWKYLPKAKIIRPVYTKTKGYVTAMATREIGLSIIELKGGRTTPDQKLDYATGYSEFCQIGDEVGSKDKPLAIVHTETEDQYAHAAESLQQLITISSQKPAEKRCIYTKIG